MEKVTHVTLIHSKESRLKVMWHGRRIDMSGTTLIRKSRTGRRLTFKQGKLIVEG